MERLAFVTTALVVGGTVLWIWNRKRQRLRRDEQQIQEDADTPKQLSPPVPKQLSPPVRGFLVAAIQTDGFGGFIPEDTDADGPPSTDDEEESPDTATWASFRGVRYSTEGSFRQRSNDKVERAQGLKASTSSLPSHLCTPAQHNRKVEERHLESAAPPLGSRTVQMTHRRLKEKDSFETIHEARSVVAPIPPWKPKRADSSAEKPIEQASAPDSAAAAPAASSLLAGSMRASKPPVEAPPPTTTPAAVAGGKRAAKKSSGKSMAGFDALSARTKK